MKIDGKEIADKIFEDLRITVNKLKDKGITPHLAIILVGNDPASVAYVNQKKLKGEEIGTKINIKLVSSNTSQESVLSTIEQLNNDNNVHGIIVQQPLPQHIDIRKITQTIDPKKDVDGFLKDSKFNPPIAMAVLKILEKIFLRFHLDKGGTFTKWLVSQKIVILGKGETGGKPIISMFKKMGIQPTVIDSKTKNPKTLTKNADIIISAVGKPNVIKTEMIKKGIILIGVGIHKGKDKKLHGDYGDEKIKSIASFYTPTPGGVGPVNVAMLLKNVVKAAENELASMFQNI